MARPIASIVLAGAALLGAARLPAAEAPVRIVAAGLLGTEADDDLQGATPGPDGTLYVVGNAGAALADLPGRPKISTFGRDAERPGCGRGFVAHLSADGRKVLHCAQLARGLAILTTVRAAAGGVYAAGYASEALAPLLAGRSGLMSAYPLAPEEPAQPTTQPARRDPIAGRPGLGRRGAPVVLRFSADLSELRGGTYLEGWQQVWEKFRVLHHGSQLAQTHGGRPHEGGFREHCWQPTHLAVLRGGDVIVCHDGGYFRTLSDEERRRTAGKDKLAGRLGFYDVCDYVSRLSGDLSRRAWRRSIYTPPTGPNVAARLRDGWWLPHYGNPRTHRMRLDADENIFVCGWSASATSNEPWWAPYVLRLRPGDGQTTWRAYEQDPLAGGGNRMGGQVADTAVTALAIEADGNVLAGLHADGGNTVMSWSPRGDRSRFEAAVKGPNFHVGLMHFWGQVQRVDLASRRGLAATRIGPWAWVTELAAAPSGGVLAVGRYNGGQFAFTDDAWSRGAGADNPNAFVRLYSPQLDLVFSAALPGVWPFELADLGGGRFALVGRADKSGAPLRDALPDKPRGRSDGYLLILAVSVPPAAAAK